MHPYVARERELPCRSCFVGFLGVCQCCYGFFFVSFTCVVICVFIAFFLLFVLSLYLGVFLFVLFDVAFGVVSFQLCESKRTNRLAFP